MHLCVYETPYLACYECLQSSKRALLWPHILSCACVCQANQQKVSIHFQNKSLFPGETFSTFISDMWFIVENSVFAVLQYVGLLLYFLEYYRLNIIKYRLFEMANFNVSIYRHAKAEAS